MPEPRDSSRPRTADSPRNKASGRTVKQLVSVVQHKHITHALINAESLDYMAIDKMKRAINSPVNQAFNQALVLDLSHIQQMSSLVMGALIQILMQLKRQGQRLILVGLNPRVRTSLASTRVDQLFEIFDDVDQAIKAVH